jgi:hypothetical protein
LRQRPLTAGEQVCSPTVPQCLARQRLSDRPPGHNLRRRGGHRRRVSSRTEPGRRQDARDRSCRRPAIPVQLEEGRALPALPTSADDRQLRDDRARTGRHPASIGEWRRIALDAVPRAVSGDNREPTRGVAHRIHEPCNGRRARWVSFSPAVSETLATPSASERLHRCRANARLGRGPGCPAPRHRRPPRSCIRVKQQSCLPLSRSMQRGSAPGGERECSFRLRLSRKGGAVRRV